MSIWCSVPTAHPIHQADEFSTAGSCSLGSAHAPRADKGRSLSTVRLISELLTTLSCRSVSLAGITNDVTGEAVELLNKHFLQHLKDVPYDQVAQTGANAFKVYANTSKLGGNPTTLKGKVDSYAKEVEAFLTMWASITVDSDRLAYDISHVEERH